MMNSQKLNVQLQRVQLGDHSWQWLTWLATTQNLHFIAYWHISGHQMLIFPRLNFPRYTRSLSRAYNLFWDIQSRIEHIFIQWMSDIQNIQISSTPFSGFAPSRTAHLTWQNPIAIRPTNAGRCAEPNRVAERWTIPILNWVARQY